MARLLDSIECLYEVQYAVLALGDLYPGGCCIYSISPLFSTPFRYASFMLTWCNSRLSLFAIAMMVLEDASQATGV